MMDKDKNDQFYKNHIIDLIEYRKEKEKEKSERVSKLKKNIEALENELVRTKEELADLMSYKPAELTEEKIQQLIKEYENGKDGNS
jgi:phage shock protein A